MIWASFIAFGLWWVLQYSPLALPVRRFVLWLSDWANIQFVKELFVCSFCFSYHVSWILFLFQGAGFKSFILAFGSAAIAYLISLVEKLLITLISKNVATE